MGEICIGGSSTNLRYVFLRRRRAYHVEVDSPSQVYRCQSHPGFGLDFIMEVECYHCWEIDRKVG